MPIEIPNNLPAAKTPSDEPGDIDYHSSFPTTERKLVDRQQAL